jgi:hypothetical protein
VRRPRCRSRVDQGLRRLGLRLQRRFALHGPSASAFLACSPDSALMRACDLLEPLRHVVALVHRFLRGERTWLRRNAPCRSQ